LEQAPTPDSGWGDTITLGDEHLNRSPLPHLSNRIFTSYDNLVDHCCHAWNKLVAQPWTVMSLGLRDWAHGF
jgi:hypothetical protein